MYVTGVLASPLQYICQIDINSNLICHHLQVLEVMGSEGDIDKERWKMPEEEEEQDEFWGFEDLENECNNSSFSISPHDSISTGSC